MKFREFKEGAKEIEITQKVYDKITARLSELKKMDSDRLKKLYQDGSRLDMSGFTKSARKTDMVYAILNNEFSRKTLEAYDAKRIKE